MIYIYIFVQESYDHRRYLSLISGVYPGYFVFLVLLDPWILRVLRSMPSAAALSKIGTRNEGSRLVSDEGMVKCDDFSPNQLMMNPTLLKSDIFILYINLVGWLTMMMFILFL